LQHPEETSMTPATFDPKAHARAMRAGGWWRDRTLDELLGDSVARHADKPGIVAYRADRAEPVRMTYAELGRRVARVAGSLRALGVGHGDVVAVQLPNWWEFVVVALAANRLGAAVNPLMPIFRERELRQMLGFSEARMLVVPKVFRGFDHEAMAAELKAELPKLEHVVVVDGEGANSFERLLMQGKGGDVERVPGAGLTPDDLALLMFTSGTTGAPKGVMHTCNTLIACLHALSGRFGLGETDILLCATPMGHMTGYLAVALQAIQLGSTLVMQDVWDGTRGVEIMARERVTYTAASTPFLVDICDRVAAGASKPPLRRFLCGGAPIPPVVIERARDEMGLAVSSLWGMTESLSSTLTEPERALEKSSKTDGRAVEGVAVKVVDDDGRELAAGETGRLFVRGAQMFLGYYKRPDIPTFDAGGWFDTGDLAYDDGEGYIRINGRTKDVLIRGGENVPVFEIESLVHQHPAVAACALVGYPDDRLGERGVVFAELRPGTALTVGDVQAWMEKHRVAKQYWPERVEVVPALPRTPSGKIQKFQLRERAKAFGEPAKKA
jgi:cyclohexanecarboxylate-CoA ligase